MRALASPQVTGGMRPKLAAAMAALSAGASMIWIGKWHGPGTLDRVLHGTERGTYVGTVPSHEEATHE
jgi:glutamate 5-kinase